MSLSTFVKSLQNIMRNDEGINGDAQRIEQIVWLLFLKIYDAKEEEWEFMDSAYRSIIPEKLRWRSWAVDKKDGKALTGDALLNFVNNKLFPGLRDLPLDETSSRRQRIVRAAFEDNNNFMKKGVLLRQVINVIDAIDVSPSTAATPLARSTRPSSKACKARATRANSIPPAPSRISWPPCWLPNWANASRTLPAAPAAS